MNIVALLVLALVVLPALGLGALIWTAIASEADDVRLSAGIKGMHFED